MEKILAKRLGLNEEEEKIGPSVDSDKMEERIEARRIRIEKRVEAQRRAERGENLEDKNDNIELSKSRKQIEESRQRIAKLTRDGNEFISNIRVAGDARENSRRTEEDEIKRHQREKIDNEWRVAMERFDEITKKWMTALQKDIPQDLLEMLNQQNKACQGMIEDKNKLIDDLQLELKAKDDQYVKELKKQAEDIDLMIERMDEQIKTMTNTYREELLQIEKSFLSQRDELLATQNKQWEELLQIIRDRQTDHLKSRQKRVDDFEDQLHSLRVQHSEEYSALKIKLETDVQILEQQLQMMKATYQLNLEKLEYNLQVLKKRDDENTITKSQQKRKITRMQDTLNNLKNKLIKQEKQLKMENEQLTEDYARVIDQFNELQKKSKHLLAADAKKFRDIWIMNEDELKTLGQKLLDADRVIYEQQLGLPWTPADLSFMFNEGPIVSTKDQNNKVKSASSLAHKLFQTGSEYTIQTDKQSVASALGQSVLDETAAATSARMDPLLVKSTMELLCDETGFLIEGKLLRLLQPLDKDEQSLMRLDAIFSALGISTEEHIHRLVPYFVSYLHSAEDNEIESSRSIVNPDEEAHEEADAVDLSKKEENQPKTSFKHELIHPTNVVKALRAFVEDFHKNYNKKSHKTGEHSQFVLTDLEERDDSEDAAYWSSYSEGIITPDRELIWDALIDALDKYNHTLNTRARLINECDALRSQNAELRHLLHQYVNSKVNMELEIPPTRVMQLERPH